MQPMRSILFVPAHREGWAQKAVAKGVDGVIIDLEDSVPANLKEEGRAEAARSIKALAAGARKVGVYVRVNALETGMTGDDLESICIPGLDGIVLPKNYGARDMVSAEALITHFERKNGVKAGTIEIIDSLETAQAYAQCEKALEASPRVAALFAGTAKDADVSRSIGFQFTPGGLETLYLRSRAVLGSRAAARNFVWVGVWQDLNDPEGARKHFEQNRQLGFTTQVLIHPSHIEIANEVFMPSKQEVIFYKGMIDALDAAVADGRAAVLYEGQHIDYAHVKTAREVIAMAEAYAGKSN